MYRRFLLMLMFVFILIIGVACSGSNGEEQVEKESQEPESTEETEQEITEEEEPVDVDEKNNVNNRQDNSDMDQNSEEQQTQQGTQQSDDKGQSGLPETIVLNEQIQHEKGMIFVLEEIRFEEDHIQVDFNAENHTGYSQVLASAGEAKGNNLGGITLQDDTGFDYRYIAKHNARINIDDREKVKGTVSFTGTIQEDARSITLIFNPDREFEFMFQDLELVW